MARMWFRPQIWQKKPKPSPGKSSRASLPSFHASSSKTRFLYRMPRDFFKRAQSKSWMLRVHKNPYFAHDAHRRRWSMRVLALAALVTLVVGLGVGLLRARWFFITDVQIAGAIFVDEAPLREVVWRELERPAMLLSQRAHRWFFDPDALQKILLGVAPLQDRKSTRLNSSHSKISYF